jgi:hypothetical protein
LVFDFVVGIQHGDKAPDIPDEAFPHCHTGITPFGKRLTLLNRHPQRSGDDRVNP